MHLNLKSPGWENPFTATLIKLTETQIFIRSSEYLTQGMKIILGNHEREISFQIHAVESSPINQNYTYALTPLENIDTQLIKSIKSTA